MSIFSAIGWFFSVTEQDVLALIVKIKQAEAVVARDISAALGWIADNTPAIVADIEQVLSIVQVVGIADPKVELAVTAANEAVAALNAYATAYKNGTGTVQAVVSGYSALKQAQAAAATATAVTVAA